VIKVFFTSDKLAMSKFTFPGIDLSDVSVFSLLLLLAFFIILALVVTILARYAYKLRQRNVALEAEKKDNESAIKELKKTELELSGQIRVLQASYANSERLYAKLLSSAEDGIAYYDTGWELKFANRAFFSLIGYSQEEYFNIDSEAKETILLHPDDNVYTENRKKALEEEGYYEAEIRIRHRDSHYVVLSSKSVVVKSESDELLGYLIVSRDITSLKEAQNELIVARDKAEESNRLKSAFLANISHEIRTPLNSIVGFANLLNDIECDDETRKEYLGYLNQNTERLLQIIGDIIDLSRLENSEIEIHYNPLRINSVLDYIETYTLALIEKSGKDISFNTVRGLQEGRDIVYADEVWLKRVFRHLLENAVKFTRSGSIELSSAMAGTSMMFTVKDTGIGIGKEHLQNIFEQFRQEIDGHHRPFEGLGVGLTLTRHVVEQMDGYLWVESEKGKGSEFYFTIPYRPVESPKDEIIRHEETRSPDSYNWKGKKILVVDDNHDILQYLNSILSDTGVSVILSRSGEEAIKVIDETEDIDLVLLDMQMEGMNGLETTREIRKRRNSVPIVAQTAFVFEEEQDFILDAGCDACLIKPIRQDKLYAVVSNLLTKPG
jgi:PAS domain S-box-containing protein